MPEYERRKLIGTIDNKSDVALFKFRDLTDSMTFSSAPKALQSIENTHRKQSVSLFLKSLEFYASSVELSEDGKMARIYRQPKANMGKTHKKEEKAGKS